MQQGVGHLVLNRPPSNAMTGEFFREICGIRQMLSREIACKAILIYSRGRHFSSGADLDELLPRLLRGNTDPEANYHAFRFFELLDIPVISAIRGVCLGSAMELALFSHFRFCGEDAVFGLPETTFNLVPGIGGIRRFAELAGNARALEYILNGKTFDAVTALEMGIVDRIWPKKEVVHRSAAFAQGLPGNYRQGLKELYLMREK